MGSETCKFARSAKRLFALAALLLVVPGAGCKRASRGPLMPVYRLVDASATAGAPRSATIPAEPWSPPASAAAVPALNGYPSVSIGDDTRLTLYEPPSALVFSGTAELAAGGMLRLEVPLPPELRRAERVLLDARLKVDDGAWQRLAPSVVRVPGGEGAADRRIVVSTSVRARAAETVTADIRAFALPEVRDQRLVFEGVTVPRAARLEFGYGIVPQALAFGDVEFGVDVCVNERCDAAFEATLVRSKPERRWHDAAVDLARYAGQRVRLVFRSLVLGGANAASLPVWSNPTIYAPVTDARVGGVNVILLSIDTLRADHLPLYGYGADTAPFMSRKFGSGGVVFDHCVAAATRTDASHMSMFTGLPPCVHGVGFGTSVLAGTTYTLAEYLHAFGVEAAAFTEDGWLDIGYGFGRGFDRYVENKSFGGGSPAGQVEVTFAQATEWLRANHDKRFFLFVHTYQVHAPYAPPQEDLERLRTGGYYQGPAGSGAGEKAAFENMIRYDAEIRYTDDRLARLWATIEELGLDENTVFVLTADHGEEFLEHGHLLHGADNYEEATHVPLMMAGPGLAAGRRVPGNVMLADLMPTILELMDVPVPRGIAGKSLLAAAGGEAMESQGRAVFAESLSPFAVGPNGARIPFMPPAYSVQIGTGKLHRYRKRDGGYRYEYYDLRSDPGERSNAYDPGNPAVERLRAALDDYESGCQAASGPASESQSPGGARHMDPEREEKLRALGYLH